MKESNFNRFFLRTVNTCAYSWDELSTLQFRKIAGIIFSNHSDHAKLILCLAVIMDLKWYSFRKKVCLAMLDDDQMEEMGRLALFIFDLESATEKNLLKKFTYKLSAYYGPRHDLTSMTWGDFRNVSDYLNIYHYDRDKKHIASALALVYKSWKDGDDNDSFKRRVKLFQQLPDEVLMAFYLNFMLMMNAVSAYFSHVLKKSSPKKKSKPALWHEYMGQWLNWKAEDYRKKDELPMMEVLGSLDGMIRAEMKKK